MEDSKEVKLKDTRFEDAWRRLLGSEGQRGEDQSICADWLKDIIVGRVFDKALDINRGLFNAGSQETCRLILGMTAPKKAKKDIKISK